MSVSSLHILTLNCWGLKYLSQHRSERLSEIGNRLATHEPPLDIVGLQECWTYADYKAIRDVTRIVLPYGKFYHSGIFGGGLVILSRFPITESSMFRYPLNGRPTAFFRGDWFVGKGVACAKLQLPDNQVIEVFNTHLHAPYEREPNDSYICHRTAQAWEIAKLMRDAQARGSLVIGLGDFNMVPMSFAHVLIENRGAVRDVWREMKPASSIGASVDVAEADRRKRLQLNATPNVDESLNLHGHTCDTIFNTWRWNEAHRKDLEKGRDRQIPMTEQDPRAKRLDYIFFGGLGQGWKVQQVKVTLTERHPTLRCSLSDHFAVETTIVRSKAEAKRPLEVHAQAPTRKGNANGDMFTDIVSLDEDDLSKVFSKEPTRTTVSVSFYEQILAMIHKYTLRERKQRRWRLMHFIGSALFSIGSFVAVWWSRYNYVAFILLLSSTLGLMAGTIDGLIGGLFVGSELRALQEFEWEVRNALYLAGGPMQEEQFLRDWYD
ncbi:phospholipase C type enzyme [Neophaeococcomyces mojaviensis]|uniref:Phospholipase C type enzyme n=1 Tax=Neophaeococcomyces mojaviensis TaxID=3383035 RepID=A0ACC3AGP9_9EURO|nr:phospholipase C type enzyme [Knufia sp. JES_112]